MDGFNYTPQNAKVVEERKEMTESLRVYLNEVRFFLNIDVTRFAKPKTHEFNIHTIRTVRVDRTCSCNDCYGYGESETSRSVAMACASTLGKIWKM